MLLSLMRWRGGGLANGLAGAVQDGVGMVTLLQGLFYGWLIEAREQVSGRGIGNVSSVDMN
jgi:hypothetical protein